MSLLARDLKAARVFYAGLFGWEYRPGWQGEDLYVIALVDGMPTVGLGTPPGSTGCAGPVSWTVFFGADDADDMAQSCREHGATVAVGPMDFGKGRVAWAADPDGASFGLWEGETARTWHLERRAGRPVWLELRTRDAFDAARFYGAVFGWDNPGPVPHDVRFEHDRVILRIGGQAVAGLFGGAVEAAPDPHVRPRWHVYFCVEDVDAAVRQATDLGGSVLAKPEVSPYGRVAALRDPEGGMFGVASVTR